MSQSRTNEISTVEDLVKQSPVLGTLFVLSILNWFLFFAISMYLHGDALGTLPSRDGFVVMSHGHRTAVSQSAWVFSLFYSGATVMLTPAIWIASAARIFGGRWSQAKWFTRFGVPLFICIWCLAWYSSIGGSFRHSVKDWQKLKESNHSIQRTGASPSAQAVFVAQSRLAPAADAAYWVI